MEERNGGKVEGRASARGGERIGSRKEQLARET